MKRPMIVPLGVLLLVAFYPLGVGTRAEEGAAAAGGIVFDWTVINDTFHVEVKNGSTRGFTLDKLFVEGFNVQLVGLNAEFKQIYKSEFRIVLERAPPTLIHIAPGNYYRTPHSIEDYRKTLPKEVQYIRLRWASNELGTPLPRIGLETCIYELRKDPNKRVGGDGQPGPQR